MENIRFPQYVLGMAIGFAAGLAITVPAGLLAVGSGGLGHGDYLLAWLLYPYTMLLWDLSGGSITSPHVALAIAQFPLYGAMIGVASPRKRLRRAVACGLSAAHLFACCVALIRAIPRIP